MLEVYFLVWKVAVKWMAVGLVLVLLFVSLGMVFARSDPADFSNPTLIWNSNGQSWPPTWQNLQASLNCGGVTYLPATTIVTPQTITMPSGCAIVGTIGFSVLKGTSSLTSHLITNVDQEDGNGNLLIDGLTLDGSHPDHSCIQYGVLWTKVQDGTICNVEVKNTGRDGIRVVASRYCTVSDVRISNTGHHSVIFAYGTSFSEMSHILVEKTEYEPFIIEHANPSTGELCHDITIADCISQQSTQYGCYIGDCYNVVVTNVAVNHSSGEGFEITDCHDITVTSCIVSNNLMGPGFEVTGTASHVAIANCIVRSPHGGLTPAYALLGQNLRMTNCQSWNTAQPLYFEQGTSKNISVASCTFSNFSAPSILRGDAITLESNTWLHQTAPMAYVLSIDTGKKIIIISNDFRDTHPTSRAINDATCNAILSENFGFPTDVYRKDASLTIGLHGTYGTPMTCKSAQQHFSNPMVKLIGGGTLASGEIITVKIQAVYSNGNTRSIEKAFSMLPYNSYLETVDWFSLAPSSQVSYNLTLSYLNFSAKTSKGTTAATCTISCLNFG
jgi:hypothetical protein